MAFITRILDRCQFTMKFASGKRVNHQANFIGVEKAPSKGKAIPTEVRQVKKNRQTHLWLILSMGRLASCCLSHLWWLARKLLGAPRFLEGVFQAPVCPGGAFYDQSTSEGKRTPGFNKPTCTGLHPSQSREIERPYSFPRSSICWVVIMISPRPSVRSPYASGE